ncbi:MAG: HipA domain-containing protein, partial [Propionibacteriaceae bacterium]|nr:HipA domain-containing protein [Propionibacteriaceae bacterium]
MSAQTLVVFLGSTRVGLVTRADGPTVFSYDPAYLESDRFIPVSLSFHATAQPQSQRVTHAWLQGILPASEEARAMIARRAGVRPTDLLGLLAEIGLDCPGAVRLVRPGEESAVTDREDVLEQVSEEAIAERLAVMAEAGDTWIIPGDESWSLGGAQSKFTLTRRDGLWHRPLGGAASTHLVKQGAPGVRLQALNEHVCLTALRDIGLSVVRSDYREFSGRPAIIVERFDRRQAADGSAHRLHQEDLCQALGLVSAYERRGGPRVRDISDLLRGRLGEESNQRFVDGLIANYALGAPDGHARNYSILLMPKSRAVLAPLYDVASALPYRVADQAAGRLVMREVAMSIGGERRFGYVRRSHWQKLFAACGGSGVGLFAGPRDREQPPGCGVE